MIQLKGSWKEGYAFDIHTISSIFTGNNEYGHPTYDTKRTEMGQCIYQLKYGQHLSILEKIVSLVLNDISFNNFIKNIDVIYQFHHQISIVKYNQF